MNAFASGSIPIGATLGLKKTLWEVRIGHLWEDLIWGSEAEPKSWITVKSSSKI